jgi:hypothetical protein
LERFELLVDLMDSLTLKGRVKAVQWFIDALVKHLQFKEAQFWLRNPETPCGNCSDPSNCRNWKQCFRLAAHSRSTSSALNSLVPKDSPQHNTLFELLSTGSQRLGMLTATSATEIASSHVDTLRQLAIKMLTPSNRIDSHLVWQQSDAPVGIQSHQPDQILSRSPALLRILNQVELLELKAVHPTSSLLHIFLALNCRWDVPLFHWLALGDLVESQIPAECRWSADKKLGQKHFNIFSAKAKQLPDANNRNSRLLDSGVVLNPVDRNVQPRGNFTRS